MAGVSGKASNFGLPENKIKYNGIEFESDLDLIVYDAFYRELDPQTGKWWEIDPKWEKDMENWGAYVSNFSNPIRNKDPKGDCPKCDEVFKDVKSSVKETLVSAYDGAVSVARELNQFNPLANLYEVISGKSIASDFTQPKPRLMAVADMGVNSLMLFGPKVALGFSTEAKVVNGGRTVASAENVATKEVAISTDKVIKGFTPHATNQAITRGFKTADILKIVREGKPIEAMGRYGSQTRYTLGGNTVVINAKGKVVTVFSNAPGTSKGIGKSFFIPFK